MCDSELLARVLCVYIYTYSQPDVYVYILCVCYIYVVYIYLFISTYAANRHSREAVKINAFVLFFVQTSALSRMHIHLVVYIYLLEYIYISLYN